VPEEDLPVIDIASADPLADEEKREEGEDEDDDEGLQETHSLEGAVVRSAVVFFDELVKRDVVFDPAFDPVLPHCFSLEMNDLYVGEKDNPV
jgi:hypothetical protein